MQPSAVRAPRARAQSRIEVVLRVFMGLLPEVDDESELRRGPDDLDRRILLERDLGAVGVGAVDLRVRRELLLGVVFRAADITHAAVDVEGHPPESVGYTEVRVVGVVSVPPLDLRAFK